LWGQTIQPPAFHPGIWSSGALDLGAEVAKIPWRLLLTKATAMRSLGLSPRLAKEVGEYPCIALQLIHEMLGKI
jgi:hypothetical protein